jgi:hypothetical protein
MFGRSLTQTACMACHFGRNSTLPSPVAAFRATIYDPISNRMTVFREWNCCAAPLSNETGTTWRGRADRQSAVGTIWRHGHGTVAQGWTNRGERLGHQSDDHFWRGYGDHSTSRGGEPSLVLSYTDGLGVTADWYEVSIAGPQPSPRGGTRHTENTITYNLATNAITLFGGYTDSGS